MTLKQAFKMWEMAPRNAVLAARSRDAVQKVLMRKWNDIELEQITERFARQIFLQSTESKEYKFKAASILVYLLQWGGDHGYCQRPTFTFEIANEPNNAQAAPKSEPATDEPKQETSDEPKQETTDMESKKEHRPSGRKARQLAQIHPDTLQVVKVWPSISEAERETGACNLDRVVTLLRKSAGFYWCNAEDVVTFRQRLAEKQQATVERQKQQAEKMREKKAASEQGKRDAGISTSEREQARPQGKVSQQTPAPKAIADCTDDELLDELDRRGWVGELRRMQVVSIGAGNNMND